MSIIMRGYTTGTILERGFTRQTFRDYVVAIFISSKLHSVVNIMSRIL